MLAQDTGTRGHTRLLVGVGVVALMLLLVVLAVSGVLSSLPLLWQGGATTVDNTGTVAGSEVLAAQETISPGQCKTSADFLDFGADHIGPCDEPNHTVIGTLIEKIRQNMNDRGINMDLEFSELEAVLRQQLTRVLGN